jgi:hypothetical protein
LRVGYLVLGGGLALVKWPLFFHRDIREDYAQEMGLYVACALVVCACSPVPTIAALAGALVRISAAGQ